MTLETKAKTKECVVNLDRKGNEMPIFRQSVYNSKDGGLPLRTRKAGDEVHSDLLKYHIRYGQRLQKTCRVAIHVLHL